MRTSREEKRAITRANFNRAFYKKKNESIAVLFFFWGLTWAFFIPFVDWIPFVVLKFMGNREGENIED